MTYFRLSTILVLSALIAGACSKNNSNPVTPTCTVTAAAPSSSSFGPEGGTGTVAVTAGSGCSWTAASNASFITISQGASGSGNGNAQFTVAANTTTADRSGSITVGGSSFTITQRATTVVVNPVTIGAPTASSPIGGTTITGSRPTLVVNNAAITGTPGTVTYRFEVSDQSAFPADPARTFSVDGVAQGSGTTSGVIPRDLGPSVLWYWHARATNGTVTGAYSATETFRTASTCTYVLSATSFTANPGGDTLTVNVTTDSACAWTASSNASFITVTAGASGSGNGTVTLSVAGSGGAARSGTVTIAGQTVTVNQGGTALVVGFRLLDPGRGPGPQTECQIRSLTSGPTTCVLESTSFPLSTNAIVSYDWTVQYIYPLQKTLTQSGSNSTFSFGETCGQLPSSAAGEPIDLAITLTVTDTTGQSVTVRSGSGSQPALLLRTFTCGI